MFLDEAKIDVTGGNGGRGCVSWRREKYVAKGGPNGGNGGNGGNIYLIADPNTDTLSNYASKKVYKAEKGRFGMGKNKNGKDGEDLWLKVPPGTIISEVDGDVLADLKSTGDQYLIARGGRGGYGNSHFKSSTRQRPDFAELGEPGEEKKVKLELKLVADVGIIGYPSVGKSTLISVISAAKPKIADYPFTTIVPNLGVVTADDRSYVVCDVPGLIEGASEGKGLGDQFLRHIERCGLLVHMLDLSRALKEGNEIDADVLVSDYKAIRKELEHFSPTLSKKKELIVLNKTDLIIAGEDRDLRLQSIIKDLKKAGIEVFDSISAATKGGTDQLTLTLLPMVLEERASIAMEEESEAEKLPVLKPHLASERMGAYRIEKKDDGSFYVTGKRLEQLVKMTDAGSEGGIRRFRDVIDKIGLKRALNKAGATEESQIFIGEVRVDTYL